MTRLGRILAVLVIGIAAFSPLAAHADCTNPMDNDFGHCSPGPSGPPATPKPTAKPTSAPKPVATAAPTHHFVPAPVQQPNQNTDNSTPEPTAFPIEATSPSPDAATNIEVETDQLSPGQATLETKDTASASSWIFGFIVGLIIGGLIGRASWGLRRRRRQQIFG